MNNKTVENVMYYVIVDNLHPLMNMNDMQISVEYAYIEMKH